jgi:hypothetical protein
VALCALSTATANPARAQERDGGTGTRIAGAALGAVSLGTLTTVAALIPCNRTLSGPVCVRPATALGGVVGLGAGIGAGADQELIEGAAGDAAVGALIGGAALLALQPFLERWSWADVAAGGLIGGAIGGAGADAAIGFGIGAGVGTALMFVLPDFGAADAGAVALLGLAAGGAAGWISRALEAKDAGDTPLLSFTVGWAGP